MYNIIKKYILNFDNYFSIIGLFVSTLFHAFTNILRRKSIDSTKLLGKVHGTKMSRCKMFPPLILYTMLYLSLISPCLVLFI